MTDAIFHGPPGVDYEPLEFQPGDAVVSQIPSVVIIEESQEVEDLFWLEVLATELWNIIRHELRSIVFPLKALQAEMRSINFRGSSEEKAEYDTVRAEFRAEVTRLIGPNGVMRAKQVEVDAAKNAMHEAREERLAVQRKVRQTLFAARLGKSRRRR